MHSPAGGLGGWKQHEVDFLIFELRKRSGHMNTVKHCYVKHSLWRFKCIQHQSIQSTEIRSAYTYKAPRLPTLIAFRIIEGEHVTPIIVGRAESGAESGYMLSAISYQEFRFRRPSLRIYAEAQILQKHSTIGEFGKIWEFSLALFL